MGRSVEYLEGEILILKNKITRIKTWLIEKYGLEIPHSILKDNYRATVQIKNLKNSNDIHLRPLLIKPDQDDLPDVNPMDHLDLNLSQEAEESTHFEFEDFEQEIPESGPPQDEETQARQKLVYEAFDLDPEVVGSLSVHFEEPPKINRKIQKNKKLQRAAELRELKKTIKKEAVTRVKSSKHAIPQRFAHLNLTFNQWNYLNLLKKRVETNPESLLRPCGICSTIIKHAKLLPYHILSAHARSGVFFCPHANCNKEFPIIDGLYIHLKIVHGTRHVQCSSCSKVLKESNLKAHLLICLPQENREDYPCPHCPKVCPSRNSRANHIRNIHAKQLDYPFKCPHEGCGIGFQKKIYFHEHLAKHLTGCTNSKRVQVVCQHCGKLVQKQSLQNHIKEVHQNIQRPTKSEGPIPCAVCGKLISSKSMARHLRNHQNRPTCEVDGCGKTFLNNTNLKEHYAVHINPNNVEYNEEFAQRCPQKIKDYIKIRKESKYKCKKRKRD